MIERLSSTFHMVCHKPWHLQCLKPNIPLRPCVAHDMKSIFIQIYFHGCLCIEMTHNVKLISERTDIKFSVSYFPEKYIFLFNFATLSLNEFSIFQRKQYIIFLYASHFKFTHYDSRDKTHELTIVLSCNSVL